MSSQRSNCPERLDANPSRTQRELAIEHEIIKITFVRLSDISRHENARSAVMIIVLEKASAWWDYAWLTFKNPSSSFVEITGYYVDRYASVGAFLRIAPNSSGTLGVQTHLLQKGQQYSVYVTIKGTQALEGPFKVQLPAAESEGT